MDCFIPLVGKFKEKTVKYLLIEMILLIAVHDWGAVEEKNPGQQ